MRQLLLPLAAVLAWTLAACSSIDCPVQNTVYTVYSLYGSDGQSVQLLDTLSVWTRRADQTDTLLLNRAVGVSSFELPISYASPEDTLFLSITGQQGELGRDTVWVKKDSHPHFESVDCSASFFHTITGVRCTQHLIDSIVIHNPNVNYDATNEHFHLYLKTGS